MYKPYVKLCATLTRLRNWLSAHRLCLLAKLTLLQAPFLMRKAHSLEKLASLTQTILGLLDFRTLRLTHSHTKPVLLACSHKSKFGKTTFFL